MLSGYETQDRAGNPLDTPSTSSCTGSRCPLLPAKASVESSLRNGDRLPWLQGAAHRLHRTRAQNRRDAECQPMQLPRHRPLPTPRLGRGRLPERRSTPPVLAIPFSFAGELTPGLLSMRFPLTGRWTFRHVSIVCVDNPTGSEIILEVLYNGQSIYGSLAARPTCPGRQT